MKDIELTPNASFSVTLRLTLTRRAGSLGAVTTAIGAAGVARRDRGDVAVPRTR